MEMSVKSKVDEINLRPHEFLLPLFEVVVNSILSVTEKFPNGGGLIEIKVERDKKPELFSPELLKDSTGKIPPVSINNISIIDNGVGFDDDNFKSFNTAYSEKNRDRGCKGVGRFTVLACFDNMHVNSIYKNKGQQFNREFTFNVLDEVQPKDGNPVLLENAENSLTVISLNAYKPKFKDKTALSTLQIAKDVIEHCLPFFINKNIPTIVLKDDLNDEELVLNDIVKTVINFVGQPVVFHPIKDSEPFSLLLVRRSDAKNHRLRLCANNRVVGRSENIGGIIPGFENSFKDDNGDDYCLDVYVLSPFLDRRVNTVRNSFNIPNAPEDNIVIDEITIAGIHGEIKGILENKYATTLEKIQAINYDRIKSYILNPKKLRVGYRSLLQRKDLLKGIPTNLSDDKLEEFLHKIKFVLERELSYGLKKVTKRGKIDNYEEYSSIVKKLIDQEAQFAKDKLADLLIQRKSILLLLKKMLKISKDGEYKLEEDLHNLIFPMGQSNDSIPYEYHNLWLLDERLAFHSYINSDKQIRKNPLLVSDSRKEPDIAIFDFPWAFSEKEGQMNSMVIFEFKRPGRDMDTSLDKNLDSQIMKYFQDLMQSKARDYDGELINMEKTTPKFGYVVCDLHKDLVEHNTTFNGFKLTPYKTLYKLNDVINLHIEVMSYQQLIEMSEKKHYAFFKELGLEN
ncbi:Histidine kinase-, DNA gyrase B-, and HSP90-like ATPase [Pedobacter terrae]|uniref:Histidine kinase-, DNA gyrase B-, and HSP90-like ATPase n=1 Tax=Pedobacter terrae TaxID=405671 RepID=A0A1G7Z5C6_9SPHI|nr:ATP-binding protein [Pedobacter terrae]SDH03933.1 Histidine kinase-, DNA gyrase B-, and HSP90-like ATPase [Pedobacter terrae]